MMEIIKQPLAMVHFAQIGSGFLIISVTLLSAIAGTWVYGSIREKLPH